MVKNQLATNKFALQGLSSPGCWAYSDVVVVGARGYKAPGLNDAEAATHFHMWCITSSPLVLSLDVRNATDMAKAWPVIGNPEAIAVNQAWAGESGAPFAESNTTVNVTQWVRRVPAWQHYSKAVGGGKVAVLMVNHGNVTIEHGLRFVDVPGLRCAGGSGTCAVRDVAARADRGSFAGGFNATLAPHGSAFLLVGAPSSGSSA